MADEKRLIDANKAQAKISDLAQRLIKAGNPRTAGAIARAAEIIDEQPTVDAVELPKGKPGDYLEWSNGFSKRIFFIHAIIICADGIRYDLGEFAPFVHSCNIVRIMNREEAAKALEDMKNDG